MALAPGNLIAILPDCERMPPWDRPLLGLAAIAVLGSIAGAGLLRVTPARAFTVLSAGFFRDLRTANVVKNLLSRLTSAVAAGVFIAEQAVAWTPVLAMVAGALAGGFAGGRLVRVLAAPWVRAVAITAGAVLTVVYARRYWSG